MTLVKVNNGSPKTFDGLMDELFNELPLKFGKSLNQGNLNFPATNIVEKDDLYHLEMAVPGFEKQDFKISLDGDLLSVSVEKETSKTDESEKVIRKEFTSRSFKRSFTVDEKIDASQISANYENGILKLVLPKKEEVKKVTRQISIG